MTSSKPSYLPKAPPPVTITLEVRASTYELESGAPKYSAHNTDQRKKAESPNWYGRDISITVEEHGTSQVAQMVKTLSAMWETWVQSLSGEDPLEKEMATQSSILAWRLPWTEEPGGLQPMGSERVGHD